MPRRKIEAAKPAVSPIIPPPTTTASEVALRAVLQELRDDGVGGGQGLVRLPPPASPGSWRARETIPPPVSPKAVRSCGDVITKTWPRALNETAGTVEQVRGRQKRGSWPKPAGRSGKAGRLP